MNFNNPARLTELKDQCYVESKESGKPVLGSGLVRSGLLESGNLDFKDNIAYLQQAKMQLEVTNKLIQTNKQLLSEIVQLLG